MLKILNNFIFNKIGGNNFVWKRLYLTKQNVSGGKRNFELKLEELKNCVNSIPLAEGFDLNNLQNNELFTKQFNLNRISPETDSVAICFQNIDKNNQKQDSNEIKEFYIFSEGVVTFWNIELVFLALSEMNAAIQSFLSSSNGEEKVNFLVVV
uniref:Uncharacterized protein n=1 Tax=Meloidogyne enterolobii TaxID=390850 RepID=A0A6V7V1T2_MELEN|nr:unnamed protein product [Meloidogyne enterolobii]